jgi:hypothetical protein
LGRPEISSEDGQDLLAFLNSEYVVSLCDGRAWLYCTCLPGDTVSAAAQTHDGLLHLFVDLNKPQANRHAREMMRTWLGADACDEEIRRIVELIPV